MSSIIDYLDLSNINKLTLNDNIIVISLFTFAHSYKHISVYVDGINILIKMKYRFKLLLFYDDSIPSEIINDFEKNEIVVTCKCVCPISEGLFMMLIRLVPMFTDIFKYNYMITADADINIKQCKQLINILDDAVKNKYENNYHLVSLASDLLPRVMGGDSIYHIKTWYRLVGHIMVIKFSNCLPINIFDNFIFNVVNSENYDNVLDNIYKYEPDHIKVNSTRSKFPYGCDDIFMLAVMQYYEQNKINFIYSSMTTGFRIPFYYWLEVIKPSEKKQKKFLKLVKSNKNNVREFLYENGKDNFVKLYKLIQKTFGKDNYAFFEDEKIINAIRRYVHKCRLPKRSLFIKKW